MVAFSRFLHDPRLAQLQLESRGDLEEHQVALREGSARRAAQSGFGDGVGEVERISEEFSAGSGDGRDYVVAFAGR